LNDFNFIVLFLGSIAFFLKELLAKVLWSLSLYLCRNEFNYDNDPTTPDKYLHLNPNLGTFQECYITHYGIIGVTWGFFVNDGYVQKRTFWLDWAADRHNRFPVPFQVDPSDKDSIVKLVTRS